MGRQSDHRDERNSQPPIDIALLGHISLDRHETGFTPGGTVFFAAETAARLGRRAGVLTRAAKGFPFPETLSDAEWIVQPSTVTTTFCNIYHGQTRQQIIEAVAEPLQGGVPEHWQEAPILLFGPVAREIPLRWLAEAENDIVAAVLQGWLRRWDENGRVFPVVPPELWEWLRFVDVATFSREDFGPYREAVERLIRTVPLVVETRDKQGALVYENGKVYTVPPRPAHVVDPTGAGDIFTTAFLVHYEEHGDAVAAARFANVVASFAVEAKGTSGIPTRAQAEAYLAGDAQNGG